MRSAEDKGAWGLKSAFFDDDAAFGDDASTSNLLALAIEATVADDVFAKDGLAGMCALEVALRSCGISCMRSAADWTSRWMHVSSMEEKQQGEREGVCVRAM